MYHREKVFILSFIASLYKKGHRTLHFNQDWFINGIENMQQYFQENRDSYGSLSSELAMLFLKNSNGEYAQFFKAVENQNAGLLTFDNPFYISAHIKEDTDAEAILLENSDDIPIDLIEGFTDAFCEHLVK